jgi:tRNA (uracil-5-)-methyltransferase
MYSTLATPGVPQQGLISLGYNRSLGPTWLQHFGMPAAASIGAIIVGRGPFQERLVANPAGKGGPDHLVQWLTVNGVAYPQHRRDGIFVQCNTAVAEAMVRWTAEQVAVPIPGSAGNILLIEPYCGNGAFTLPLAGMFRQVLASDISSTSTGAARACAFEVGASNIHWRECDAVSACTASSMVAILGGGTTALLNPPREGVCRAVLDMSALADRVVYVSCNPVTLRRDLVVLRRTHRVAAAALFDQFPYSDHAEIAVSLERM